MSKYFAVLLVMFELLHNNFEFSTKLFSDPYLTNF